MAQPIVKYTLNKKGQTPEWINTSDSSFAGEHAISGNKTGYIPKYESPQDTIFLGIASGDPDPDGTPDDYVGIFWEHPEYKNNIERRTKYMIENGLIDEINKIQNPSKTVLQAIGMNLSENLEENINIKTKRLAKKQITWFKKEEKLRMVKSDKEHEVYNSMMEIING